MVDTARRFKALSEELRLQIVALLMQHGDLCVCEVERFLEISQSAASRHFRYLAHAGLVESRREGQWVYYRLAEAADEAHAALLSALEKLMHTIEVPEVGPELAAMREERCAEPAGCGAGGFEAERSAGGTSP